MIACTHLRYLTIDKSAHPRGQPHVSAASGLVCANGLVYVVADDEHHLAVFRDLRSDGQLFRTLPGALPRGTAARKRTKPDTESLVRLPPSPCWQYGALLAIGSGSRKTRCRAVLIPLDADALPSADTRRIDLAPVYEPLSRRFDELNIEGAMILGEHWVLLQRGHRGGAPNAVIRYHLHHWLSMLEGQSDDLIEPLLLTTHDLGSVQSVPFAFTDGAALPGGGWIFAAVAEDTDDSYADGACIASVVGVMDANDRLQSIDVVGAAAKVEGVAVQARERELDLCLVTDADDPRKPSQLIAATMPLDAPQMSR